MRADAAPSPEAHAAYAHCRAVALRSGSSFAAAFWMFPKEKRQAVYAIYAFCRFADDVADDPQLVGNRALLLERWRAELGAAYQGEGGAPGRDRPGRRGAALRSARARSSKSCCTASSPIWSAGRWRPSKTSPATASASRRPSGSCSSACWVIAARARSTTPRRWESRSSSPTSCATSARMRPRAGSISRARTCSRFGVSRESLGANPTPDELRVLLACYAERARIYYERAERLRPRGGPRAASPRRRDGPHLPRAARGAATPPLRPRRARGAALERAAARDHRIGLARGSARLSELDERKRSHLALCATRGRRAPRRHAPRRRAPAPRRAAGALDRRDRPRDGAARAPARGPDPDLRECPAEPRRPAG